MQIAAHKFGHNHAISNWKYLVSYNAGDETLQKEIGPFIIPTFVIADALPLESPPKTLGMKSLISQFWIIRKNCIPAIFKFSPCSLIAVKASDNTNLGVGMDAAFIEVGFHHHKAISPLVTTGVYERSENINLRSLMHSSYPPYLDRVQ